VRNCLDHLTAAERRALEQDLDLAGRIQRGLLPAKQMSFDVWDTFYHYEPLGPASGDYCDLITLEEGELLFFMEMSRAKASPPRCLMAHLHAIFPKPRAASASDPAVDPAGQSHLLREHRRRSLRDARVRQGGRDRRGRDL